MQATASANGVAPRNTGKETRAAMIAQVGPGRFVHPAALFPPTAQELLARRKPSSLVAGEDEAGDGNPDSPGAGGDGVDGEDATSFDADDDGLGAGDLPPPGATVTAGQQPAA